MKVNDKVNLQFGEMMETYISERKNLKAMILLVDLRHNPTADDISIYEFVKYYNVPVILVATKEDKVKRSDIKKNENKIKETYVKEFPHNEVAWRLILPTSFDYLLK